MATEMGRKPQPLFVKGTPVATNGDTMVAHAMRQVRPDVVAAYPITPQTILTEIFSEFVANGQVHTEFIPVESEHAALSAVIGSAAAGARSQTATSGPGLALMWEMLWTASGLRLPIVMHLCTRAFSAPLNILGDHHDMMGMRETGWVMLSAETAQEAYDNAIQAVRIAEHPEVMLPVAAAMDGFITTHSVERGELLPDETVARFAGEYKAERSILDLERPITIGTWDYHDYFFEHKRQQVEAMARAGEVAAEAAREFGDMCGRYYGPITAYQMDDAEVAIIILGSAAGTVRVVVDQLREEGVRAGLIRIRMLRPFPVEEIAEALRGVRGAAVLERYINYGAVTNGVHMEVATGLASRGINCRLESWTYGLGGRNTSEADFRRVYEELLHAEDERSPLGVKYLGIRE